MSAASQEVTACLPENAWVKLAHLESLHKDIQAKHDKVVRSLDEAVMSEDRRNLQIAWNQYRSVVADLSRVTEEFESLRLSPG